MFIEDDVFGTTMKLWTLLCYDTMFRIDLGHPRFRTIIECVIETFSGLQPSIVSSTYSYMMILSMVIAGYMEELTCIKMSSRQIRL